MSKSNKTATSLGTVSLRKDVFREVMDPLLDILEKHNVLVTDTAGIYVFDVKKLIACPATAYRNLLNGLFRAPGGNFIGFSNLGSANAADEKLGSPYRNFPSLPAPILGSLTSAHTGIERTPSRGGNADEHLIRVTMICNLAAGWTRHHAVNVICEFLALCSWRSRVLVPKKKSISNATQVNSLDDVVNQTKADVIEKIKDNLIISEGITKRQAVTQAKALFDFPLCALTKMINVIALGRDQKVSLYENKATATPNPVTIIEFIKKTDGEDRREYKRLCGREWPYLTDADIDEILLMYAKHFPDTITASVDVDLREALRV